MKDLNPGHMDEWSGTCECPGKVCTLFSCEYSSGGRQMVTAFSALKGSAAPKYFRITDLKG